MRSTTEEDFLYNDDESGADDDRPTERNGLRHMISKLWRRHAPAPPVQPYIIHSEAASPQRSCFPCGCCGMVLTFVVLLVGLACLITSYSLWAHVVTVSEAVTGLAVRNLGLQGQYTFTGFATSASQSVSQESLPTATTSTTSTTAQVGVLHGSFDLHAQRVDWNIVLFEDTFGLFLAPNPSGRFYLWAKFFNATSHALEHTTGSPWPLDPVRTGSKTGLQVPVFLRQPVPGRPLFYWFVVQSSKASWAAPLKP